MSHGTGHVILWSSIGAAAGALGGVVILKSATFREAGLGGLSALLLAVGVASYGSCGLAWFWIARATDSDYATGAAYWSVAGCLLSLLIAVTMSRRSQTPGEWVGFCLVMAGMLIRSLASGK